MADENARPSLMARKFMQAAKDPEYFTKTETPHPPVFEECFYFFYGTLMDQSTLAEVLNLSHHPPCLSEFYPATLHGYRMKLWGDYPAIFIDPYSDEVIHGMAYKVRSQKEEDLLAAYETDMYRRRGCTIAFEDDSEASGRTFVWNAEMELLRECRFDLKDWLMKKRELSIFDQK